jgi:hypothetical protein
VIRPELPPALQALDHVVREVADVSRGLEDLVRRYYRRLYLHDEILIPQDEPVAPLLLDLPLEELAEGAEV